MGKRFKKVLVDKRALKASALMALEGKSANEIADILRTQKGGFLKSTEWKELREKVISHYGGRVMKCGFIPRRGVNVDHIKPRKLFPELSLCFDNLQVLCGRCNKAKGNKHTTDYRMP